ncbi:MAG: putative 4-hydroxybenzoate polyprenyltransferase [Planctomycetota bacterium]|nr:putative 4-hydroxybenzoate polyprenyltransferase [Planctomycetota bacterium]
MPERQVAITHQLLEFAKTIRLSHTLFALPFAAGTALLAEPPCPGWRNLLLLLACMVTARTAAMGMNRVADAALDARNPRTAGRAIPAGRLSRRAALAMSLASGAAFIALAWGFYLLRGNGWPGVLAPAFLLVLFGYSWTKRFTFLAHWVLGLCLGLAPVGVWVALRGEIAALPVFIGAAVMFWTAGFDIFYAFQDIEVDRREGLHSVPARAGRETAQRASAMSHIATVALLAPTPFLSGQLYERVGMASLVALVIIALTLAIEHIRARRQTDAEVGAAFFQINVIISMIWFVGVLLDVVVGLEMRVWS